MLPGNCTPPAPFLQLSSLSRLQHHVHTKVLVRVSNRCVFVVFALVTLAICKHSINVWSMRVDTLVVHVGNEVSILARL